MGNQDAARIVADHGIALNEGVTRPKGDGYTLVPVWQSNTLADVAPDDIPFVLHV
jgi:hypothetical protein